MVPYRRIATGLARKYGPALYAAGKQALVGYAKKKVARYVAPNPSYGLSQRGYSRGFSSRLRNLERCIEHKFIDTTLNGTLGTTAGGIFSLTTIPLGDTVGTRDGSRCSITKLKLNCSFLNPGTETNTVGVRVFVVKYKDTNGATPTPLQDMTNLNSPYKHDQAGMTVLYDESFVLGPGNGAGTPSRRIWHWNYNFGMAGHCVKYTDGDTTGVLANTCDGLIAFYAFQTAFAVAAVADNCYARVHFVDM